jgi:hypothetical protein
MTDFSTEERLETGELLSFAPCPFQIPDADDRHFLGTQRLHRAKEIAYDPQRDRLSGYQMSDGASRLRRILADASTDAVRWVRELLPHYANELVPLKTCLHPEEEATRTLRPAARNDLLHIDAIRPASGCRILRLGINLHATDPRIWVTSSTLSRILAAQAKKSRLVDPPPLTWTYRACRQVVRLVRHFGEPRSAYDDFMLSLSNGLKLSDEVQDKLPRKTWRFPPLSAWLAFTDGLVHAELRGQCVLDHVFLVPPTAWVRPDLAPRTLIADLGMSAAA